MLDSIVPALLADKNRKFIYVEQVSQSILYLLISLTLFLAILLNATKK